MTEAALQRALDMLKYYPQSRIHNAELIGISEDPTRMIIRVDGADAEIPANGNASHLQSQVGKFGSIAGKRESDGYSYSYVFHAYLDQTLRRAPELDTQPADGRAVEWGWTCAALPNGMLAPLGFVPGIDGKWIRDETSLVDVPVPPEFVRLCEEIGTEPVEVLRGFIADLCDIRNDAAQPRADGFSSNGSDERDMADTYFERAYSWRREVQAPILAEAERNAEENQRRENALEQIDLALDDYLLAGGSYEDFVASIALLRPADGQGQDEG